MTQRFFRNIENLINGARHIADVAGGLAGRNSTSTPVAPAGPANIFNESVLSPATKAAYENIAQQTDQASLLQIRSGTDDKLATGYDWRARLRSKGSINENPYFAGPILAPLRETGGLIWQYTPNVYNGSSANWNETQGVGQNYPVLTYNNSTPPNLTVTSEFTANTYQEAKYLLAVIHFFKIITKSYYGESAVESGRYGTPPPVLLFEYLGDYGFNKVPVVIASCSFTYPNDVDYIPVRINDSVTYVPMKIEPSIDLRLSFTPNKLRKNFDLDRFISGDGYTDGYV